MSEGANYFKCLFSEYNPWILLDGSIYELGVTSSQFFIVMLGLLMILIVSAIQETGRSVRTIIDNQNVGFRVVFGVTFIYMIILFGVYGSGYEASAFAYAQF